MKQILKIIIVAICVVFLAWNVCSYFNIVFTNLDPEKTVASWNLYEIWFNALR